MIEDEHDLTSVLFVFFVIKKERISHHEAHEAHEENMEMVAK